MSATSSFSIVIDNLRIIAAVYSDAVARTVLHEVQRRLAIGLGAADFSMEPAEWGMRVICTKTEPLSRSALETVLVAASRAPIETGSGQVIAALGCICDGEPSHRQAAIIPDIRQYRSDMCSAVLAFTALENGILSFAEQVVTGPDDGQAPLYHECLARLLDADGSLLMPGAYIEAIERLGLVRLFDHHVVLEIIDRLRRRPEAVLGCNISGASTVNDIWWQTILYELQAAPDIARRLVIEITETARPPDGKETLNLIATLRAMGVRVALDDFGAGYSMTAFGPQAKVDIVKLDGSFIRQRLISADGEGILRRFVSMAGDMAAQVVIEGIETEDDLRAALAAGGRWLQGYYFGRSVAVPLSAHASKVSAFQHAGGGR